MKATIITPDHCEILPEHAAIVRSGATAARKSVARSGNPYGDDTQSCKKRTDGFDQQTIRLEQDRCIYEPFPALAGGNA